MVGVAAYTIVKFFHVLLAIIAVGFNASYAIWLARAAKEPAHELHVVKGIKILDDWFANPAYALLLITGLLMVRFGGLSYGTLWITWGLILYGLLALVGIFVFTPTLKRQIALLEAGSGGTPEYQRVAQRGNIVGSFLALVVLAIIYLMVVKPT